MKIEDKINPRLSREVLALLQARGWTLARIARAAGATRTLLNHIEAGGQSFSPAQIRSIARASRTSTSHLLFDAMEPAALQSKERALWVATRQTLQASKAFRDSLRTKPVKKRRTRIKAA
jgi:transcriptional regulator with XRE-family HTH domain